MPAYPKKPDGYKLNRQAYFVTSLGNEKNKKYLVLMNVVAKKPANARRIKNVDGCFFPEQCACSGKRPAK